MEDKVFEVVMKGAVFAVGKLKKGVFIPSGRIAILDLLNFVSGDLEILSRKNFPDSIFQFVPENDSSPINLCAKKIEGNYLKVFPAGDESRAVIISKRIFRKLFIIKPNPADIEVMITGAETDHDLSET